MRFCRPLLLISAVAVISCSSSADAPVSLAGTYHATVFRVAPSGQSATDFLALGVTLDISVTAAGLVSGSEVFPAGVTGGSAVTQDMTGTATLSGSTVHFTQSADTFVRDLAWTSSSTALSVNSQVANGASYTVTLTRQ